VRKIGDRPQIVVLGAAIVPSVLIGATASVLALSGFANSAALPEYVTGPPGPVTVAVGPQGGTETPDLSDEGLTGPEGLIGSLGLVGPQGPTGQAGTSGGPGTSGPAGVPGEPGEDGKRGPTGETGATGPKGNPGAVGQTGLSGAQGIQGFDGLTGPMGPIGPQGPVGATGATGETGPQGLTGLPGEQGPIGPMGLTGSVGPQGPAGPQGETGATGSQGPTGLTGADGPQGEAGPRGPQGEQGPAGPAGPAGVSVGYDPDWSGTGLVAPDRADMGAYIRNGNLVHFRIFVDTADVTDFGSGFYTLRLPFAPIQDYVFRDGGLHDGGHDNHYQVYADAESGSTLIYLMYHSGSKDVQMDHDSPIRLSNKTTFYISGNYEIAP